MVGDFDGLYVGVDCKFDELVVFVLFFVLEFVVIVVWERGVYFWIDCKWIMFVWYCLGFCCWLDCVLWMRIKGNGWSGKVIICGKVCCLVRFFVCWWSDCLFVRFLWVWFCLFDWLSRLILFWFWVGFKYLNVGCWI